MAEDFHEADYILRKKITCPLCEKQFTGLTLKSGKVIRTESDMDLKPRNTKGIDTTKYGVYSCPHCGYTAMIRTFDQVTRIQKKLIKEQVCDKFTPQEDEVEAINSYDVAVKNHKMALVNAVVKQGKMSEQAYICLLLGWLYRGMGEEVLAEDSTDETHLALADDYKKQEMAFLGKAYAGFVKAMAQEMPPFVDMDMNTMEFLLAALAWEVGRYEDASKMVSRVLTNTSISKRVKDKALVLKDNIVEKLHENE